MDTINQNNFPSVSPPTRTKNIRFEVIIVLVILAAAFYLHMMKTAKELEQLSGVKSPSLPLSLDPPTATPTPFPFREMTVPYLRERTYTSSVGTLQKSSENATYISYLTNYNSDGLRINALLTQPKGTVPDGGWPAVIFIHGYIPPSLYRTTENYAAYVDYLARNGLVVFKIDLRGHAQSEGEPGGAYYSSDYVIDALNAYAALQTAGFVNPNKIGLWGHSMAGNVVSRSLAAKPEIPAAVIWAGAVYTYEDRMKYGINDNSYRPPSNDAQRQQKRREMIELYGDFTPDSPFWKQVTPTNYLSDLKGAIEIHHAVNDDVVNIGYSRNLNTLLDATNIPHQLHEYPSGGHNINGASYNQAMQRTVAFFQKNLADR